MDRSKLYRRFRTLLIANRGEIACRVIRSARAMGLRTVAVYSEADRDAMHVAMADEAVLLGPARARDSYLNIERVIEAARKTGAEAVHPGYGFLSENAEFAQACLDAGLVFVGPTAAMMTAMGSKSGSKQLMEKAGVPLVPGYHGEVQDEAILAEAADKIGFPVLVKASAGGGGRGMRVVKSAGELSAAIVSAKREAKAAFGDDRMLIEKFVQNPRHIEVQIIGDSHGNLLSLFERECTLQRRHQKVIEEAPSPTLNATQRDAVCAAARKAAGAVNYVGAGTIEFVSDGKEVFFIEMNTRLQVEHPVTELITGIDLVEWQLRVAFGEKLPLKQDEIKLNGHAIEARVYAENPQKNFMPSVGRIKTWRTPDAVDGLRIDAGYRSGDAVSPYYDAMLAKVIAWAPTREAAIERLNRGLEETDVRGITTNIPFLSALVTHRDVRANTIDTGFIERELKGLTETSPPPGELELCAAVAAVIVQEQQAARNEAHSPWRTYGWQPVGLRTRVFQFRQGPGTEQKVTLHYGDGRFTVSLADRAAPIALSMMPYAGGGFDITIDGVKSNVVAVIENHELYLRTRNGRFDLHWVDPFGGETEEHVGEDKIVAPLPGTVVALLAEEGATLEKGAAILTLEVMKMEQTLRAPYAGVLKKIKCKVGDIVGEGVELAEIEPAAA
ncbi:MULTISPECIES: acetyl/propionyl/methylcrotonyl-CoA carboxylase subunit alpha [Bradyrhizobium]|jgi:3-methylcrotonyl-CoA carboxylase alpha subunit|uniref:3-methylcrotonyl-CoA carboxylase alpha subunit n=2 Tax=Bradyrhizobium TaxID=374 RepID=A0ABY0QGK0_9BRAD|nr:MULTISPECIES: acetyl/propionyl/methylcrotonyl-CoA carboxylase subunit alpha [Bradyrhizobium]SDK32587.1 3-methylcrotonyl-CoA carboxylase alpha subunit [Bradyrhizobium ottawaense]SEE39501.1 3-methylcrotonyl-CoA carboxylase alpha subunit [Bradyrhizobium lablabi]